MLNTISYEMESKARQNGSFVNIQTFKEWTNKNNEKLGADLFYTIELMKRISENTLTEKYSTLSKKLKEKLLGNYSLSEKDISNIKKLAYALYLYNFSNWNDPTSLDKILNEVYQ